MVHICRKRAAGEAGLGTNALHGIVLGIAACILSVPYDMPRLVSSSFLSLRSNSMINSWIL